MPKNKINLHDKEIKDTVVNLSNFIRAEVSKDGNFLERYAGTDSLNNIDNLKNQIVYGRRGSGKTHLFLALQEKLVKNFDKNRKLPIYIDLRKVLPLISVSMDEPILYSIIVFRFIVQEIIEVLSENIKFIYNINPFANYGLFEDLKKEELQNILSKLNISFDGNKLAKLGDINFTNLEIKKLASSLGISKNPELLLSKIKENSVESSQDYVKYISFAEISKYLSEITKVLGDIRIICFIDEWSELPLNSQPYVAELLKRGFITSKFTFKLAGITKRTKLALQTPQKLIGLEDGGDIFGYPLDNRYIFEINKDQTRDFFNELLYKHLSFINTSIKKVYFNKENNKVRRGFINDVFTNHSLSEILIASAGIPRDFINLFVNSYDKFQLTSRNEKRIGVKHVRLATIEWYKSDKKTQVDNHHNAKKLLEKIVNEIIIEKRKTHFLIPEKFNDNPYLQKLIDLRVIHVRKYGYSHKGNPGVTYNVYSLDYGCYTSINIYQPKLDSDLLDKIETIDNFREVRRVSLEDDFFNNFLLDVGEAIICPHCKQPVDTNHLAYIKRSLCNNCFEKV